MDHTIWYLAEFVILVLISGFFSGSESAFFSLSDMDVRRLKKTGAGHAAKRVLALLNRPQRLLNAILVGNTLVNVAAATVAALFTSRLLHDAGSPLLLFVIEVVVVTLVLLIFSEITPKIIAVKRAIPFARAVSMPLTGIVLLLTPISLFFETLTRGAALFLKLRKDRAFINEEEFKALFEVSEETGALKASERRMIHSIFEFRETTVREVMVPRTDVVSVEKDTPLEAFLELVQEQGHSRIPVYDGTVDNILGILHVKDILYWTGTGQPVPPLRELVREAYFIPESKGIDELLRDFQQERNHMAIVVDEYGGTAGIVTLEDVLEEIVGEIQDEYDVEQPLITQTGEKEWLADGKISIEELNDTLGLLLPEEEEFESLGGFILHMLEHIPEVGETVIHANVVMTVEQIQKQRIEKVRIEKRGTAAQAPDGMGAPEKAG
ncbi:HlyC/CorC family transporter [bacterium]|nr:HlyC/CorC family transporter [bacterium]